MLQAGLAHVAIMILPARGAEPHHAGSWRCSLWPMSETEPANEVNPDLSASSITSGNEVFPPAWPILDSLHRGSLQIVLRLSQLAGHRNYGSSLSVVACLLCRRLSTALSMLSTASHVPDVAMNALQSTV